MTRRYSTVNRPRHTSKASGARGWYDSPQCRSRSRAHLEANPFCVWCGDQAQFCDHIRPTRPQDRKGCCGARPFDVPAVPQREHYDRRPNPFSKFRLYQFPLDADQGLFARFVSAARERGVKRALALLSTDKALSTEFQAILDQCSAPVVGPRHAVGQRQESHRRGGR